MSSHTENEDGIYLATYLVLIGLTALTVASYWFGFGPALGVVFALVIATAKASLIVYYFMHLRHENSLFYGIAAVGVVAVLALAIGIFPDIALRL